MSYIIGWKNSRSVFLCGDTILSANFEMNTYEEQTSFGEKLVKSNAKSHSEAYLKIWVIGKLAVGFVSNDTYEAIDFLEKLNEEIDQNNLFTSIDEISKKYQPKKSEFLFAFNENGENKLFKYDSDYGEIYEEKEPTQIGSLPNDYMEQTYEMCSHIIDEEEILNDDDSLVLANATHQNLMIVQNSMQFDVGGMFTGLYINSDGITWQRDTMYINYETNLSILKDDESNIQDVFSPTAQIHLIIRQNCASYSSGFQNESAKTDHLFKCWVSKTTNMLPKNIIQERIKWNKECSDEIHSKFECPNPSFIVMFSNDPNIARNCIIIRSNDGNPYVRIPCLKNNYFDMDINMSIIRALKPDHEMNKYRYEFIN